MTRSHKVWKIVPPLELLNQKVELIKPSIILRKLKKRTPNTKSDGSEPISKSKCETN